MRISDGGKEGGGECEVVAKNYSKLTISITLFPVRSRADQLVMYIFGITMKVIVFITETKAFA